MKILEEMIEAATAAMLNGEFGSGGPVIMTRENWKSWGAEKTWDFYKAKAMLTLEAAGVATLLAELETVTRERDGFRDTVTAQHEALAALHSRIAELEAALAEFRGERKATQEQAKGIF